MASLKHVKNLRDNSITLLNLLKEYIFGTKEIKLYNKNKTYQKGDLIMYTNTEGKMEILQCNSNNVTGMYDSNLWDNNIAADFLAGTKSTAKPIILAENEPTDPTNVMWVQLVKTKDIQIEPIEYSSGTVIIFNANQIIGQDDEPTDTNVKLWFDYEPTSPTV